MAVYVVWRIVKRESMRGRFTGESLKRAGGFILQGHLADVAAAVVLMSPLVHRHHVLLAVPLAAWAMAVLRKTHPVWMVILIAAVFAAPERMMFPFSHTHSVALLALMVAVPPQALPMSPGDEPSPC